MTDTLQSYLHGLSNAGKFDSSGTFTVDVHKKNIKIREGRFQHSTAYLLCCVRAGVTAGSEQIILKLNHGRTTILLKSPKELQAEDVVQGVLGDEQLSPTELLLGAAFQGALAIGCTRVTVKLPGSEIRLTTESLKVLVKEHAGRHVSISFDFPRGGIWTRRRRCLEESQAVLSKCSFCPVPIQLDGLSVTDLPGWEKLLLWQQTFVRGVVHKDFVWLEAMLSEPDSRFPASFARRNCRVEYVAGERHVTTHWDPRDECTFLRIAPRGGGLRHSVGSLIRLGSSLDGPGYLYLVKQGVVLDVVEEYLGAPGVAVVIRGDDFQTDLSLFKPILEGEHYDKVLRGVRANVRALVAQLGRERKHVSLRPKLGADLVRKIALFGTGGAAAGLLTGPLGALLMGGASAFVGAIYTAWRNSDRMLVEAEQRVRWELDSYVELVAPEDDGKTRL